MQRSAIVFASALVSITLYAPPTMAGGQRGLPGHGAHHPAAHHHHHGSPMPQPRGHRPEHHAGQPDGPHRYHRRDSRPAPAIVPTPIILPLAVGGYYDPYLPRESGSASPGRGPAEGYIPPAPSAPLSFNVIDPYAVISQTPSGSIAVGSRYGYPHHSASRSATPYAPPAVHIIGDRHHRAHGPAVHVIEGAALPRRFRTEPQIIIVRGGESAPHGDDTPRGGARIIKRY
jgi:hypothetical protein